MNFRHLLFLCIACTLVACSSFKIIYNLADGFIKSEVNFFLQFDAEGEYHLNEQIHEMLKWHNTFMLPRYAAYFRNQANQIDKGVFKNANFTQAINDGRILLEGTVGGAAPYAAKILVRQTAADNVKHLSKKMMERSKEQKQNLSRSIEKRLKERTGRIKKNIERFLGDLNQVQDDLIDRYAKNTINDGQKRFINRNLRQKAFLTFLSGRPSEIALEKFIVQMILRPHEIVDPGFKEFSSNRIDQFSILLAKILSASTEEQRLLTSKNLRSLANDLEDLSN